MYGGTKTEMQRLLADAERLSGVHYDIENLGDVYQAVHVIQEEIGLTGVAAAEAEGTFTGSMQSMKAAWENLKANLATGGDVTESLMIVYQSARNFVLNNLLPMIGNILKGLPTLVSTALQQAFTDIPSLFDMVKKFVDDLSGALITQRGTFTDGFVELINGAFDMIENIDWIGLGMSIINLIINGIRAAGEALLEGVKTIGERAGETLAGIDWANLGQRLIDAMRRGLDTGSSLITEAFSTLGEAAWNIISSIDWIELGKSIIRLIIEGNLAIAETYFNTMKTIGQTAWEWMKSVDWKALGQTIITTIGTALRNAGSTIWQGLRNVGQTAWNWFRNIDWAGLGKQVLTAILTGIFTAALALYQGVRQIATQAVQTFKNTDWVGLGRQVLTSIGNGIRAVASNLWNALRSAAQSAWNTVTTINWASLGTNIINGIINGIRNAGQALVNALTGCARTAWQNAKNFLGIKSPSTLFRDTVGKFIPLGMAEGIEDEAGAVTDALNGIARDSVATIDTDLNVRAATSEALDGIGSNDQIVVNVYPSQGMDEKRLADLVSRRLALAERQRMAARGMA